jgi:GrpB-like predicted nucleotidyltransferase (UPF0157 family)
MDVPLLSNARASRPSSGAWVESVEHVGSTAVPGLDVRPVFDLTAGVRDVRDADRCIQPLEGIGYSYWAEDPNPHHRLFVRFAAERTSRTHNLHAVETGSEYWEERLLYRE